MYTSNHVLLVDTSAEFCWVRQNEAKAFALMEMAMDVAAFEDTQRNRQKCEQSVRSSVRCIMFATMTLLLSVAEFVKMKRKHLHLMSHGNGNGCCGIWTHTEKQPKTWALHSFNVYTWPCSTRWHFCWVLLSSSKWSESICTWWAMEMAMDVAAFEHTQRNSQKREHYTLSMYTSDHVLLVDTSAEFCWVRQNEAKAFAPDEPWKW